MAESNTGDVLDQHGNSPVGGDDDVLHILQGGRQSLSPDEIALVAFLDITAAGNMVVVFEGCEEFSDGDTGGLEALRIYGHFVLFEESAPGVDFDHTRDS